MFILGNSLVAQWLRLCASNAGGTGLIQVLWPKINTILKLKKKKVLGPQWLRICLAMQGTQIHSLIRN